MKLSQFFVVLMAIVLISCSQNSGNKDPKSPIKAKQNQTEVSVVTGSDSKESSAMAQIYELKDDGLYIYADCKPIIEPFGEKGTSVVQKNYKYIPVPSEKTHIKFVEGPRVWDWCDTIKKAEHYKGKPSLKELGYERHKEREIRPEDNRFGVAVTKEKDYLDRVKVIRKTTDYNVLPKSAFIEVSIKEFVENGIVIIGKHVSRVVIKSLAKLPVFKDEVVVGAFVREFKPCTWQIDKEYTILPEEIASFKKIDIKENIHEFVKDEPIPASRAYLSENEYLKLINDIHQLIPRIFDATTHKVARYVEGYYLIEYYNGDVLYDYQCIKLSKAANAPRLWDPLEVTAPKSISNEPGKDVHRLVVAEFGTIRDAEAFIYNNQIYDVLVYRRDNGKYFIGKSFNSKAEAENELNRYANRGIKKESMKIEKY